MTNSRFVTFSFIALLLLSAALVLQIFLSLITPIILALVLLSICYPVYRYLLDFFKGRRVLATSLCVALVFVLVFLPLGYFVSLLTGQAIDFYTQSKTSGMFKPEFWAISNDSHLLSQIKAFAKEYGIDVSSQMLVETTKEVFQKSIQLLYDVVTQIASHSLVILLHIFLTFIILFTLILRGSELKKYLMKLMPLPYQQQEKLMKQFGHNARAIFLGTGVINAIQGIFGGLGFYWFGIGPGTLFGVLIFLASFVPAIGAWIIAGPATFYLIAIGRFDLALGFFVFTAAVFGLSELYVKPKFIGGKSRQHAVLVLLSILGGVHVFGVFGIFFGPLIVAMFLSLADIYTEHYRERLIGH